MLTETNIINKLVDMGFNVANSGFQYIKDAMYLLESHGMDMKTGALYFNLSNKHGKSSEAIERAIRHTIRKFYAESQYIPVALETHTSKSYLPNREFLRRLYIYLNYTTK